MILIDADKLIQEMRKWYWDKEKQKAAENDVSPMDLFTHLAITTVQEQLTTFDVDKVIEQIEYIRANFDCKLCKYNDGENTICSEDCSDALIDILLEIVKCGGVE